MFVQALATALLAAGSALALPAQAVAKRGMAFNWGSEKIQGVNIGGWLILEPWITPEIFQALDGVVDEWTLGEQQGQAAGLSILQNHWDTWVTLADFQKIAGAGLNLVRLPVGYWAYQKFDSDPYIQGAAPYVDSAISWARQTGLKVLLDLHGAPGSQNGYDNSGHRIPYPLWQQNDTVSQTLQVLQDIANKYAQPDYQDVVVGIELLNEPFGPDLNMDELKSFYESGYQVVRGVSDTTVVIHDVFMGESYWDGVLTPSDNGAYNVAIDTHIYQVFDDSEVAWPAWQHRQEVCNMVGGYDDSDKWTLVGEWTAAMTDCAPALNGYGIGARYDGTYPNSTYVGSCSGFNDITMWSQQLKDDTRGFIEAQMETYERVTQGWIFWNFKTTASAEWDMFQLIDNGIFPQPLSSREFPQICST